MDQLAATTPRSHSSPLFFRIAVATHTVVGGAYFDAVTRTLRDGWHVAAAFVTEIDPAQRSRGWVVASDSTGGDFAPGARVSGVPWFSDAGASTSYHVEPRDGFAGDAILTALQAKTFMAVPLTGLEGGVIGYVGVIDNRRWQPNQVAEAEALLRLVAPRAGAELERRRIAADAHSFRSLVDFGTEPVLCWSGDPMRIEYANVAFEQLTGYTGAELRLAGASILEPMSAAAAAAGPGGETRFEARLTRKDGGQIDVACRLNVTDVDGPHGLRYECSLCPTEVDWAAGGRRRSASALTRAVLDSVDFAVAIVGDDDLVYLNRRAEAITSSTEEELLTLRIVVQRSGSDVSLTVRDWVKQVRRTKSAKTTIRLRPRRGGERSLEVRSRVTSVHGAPVVVLTATDVTEERRQEDGLEQRARLKRAILESMGPEILVLDGRGVVAWVNDRWNRRALENTAHPCLQTVQLGDNFVEQCRALAGESDETTQEVLVAIASVTSGSLPQAIVEYEVPDESAEPRSFVLAITPLLAGDGIVVWHAESTMLTSRTRELGQREMRERVLLESLPDQVARITRDGEIIDVMGPTRKAAVVPPLSPGSFRTNLRDVLPDAQAETLLLAVREATQANTLVFASLRLAYDGSDRQYEARIVPLEDGEALVVLRDRSAEQWTPAISENGESGSRRPRVVQENLYGLTFREVGVLELMAHGASDKEIAGKLGVSVFTVNKHVSRILHKMGASSRTEASIRTLREGLFVS